MSDGTPIAYVVSGKRNGVPTYTKYENWDTMPSDQRDLILEIADDIMKSLQKDHPHG